MAGPPAPAPQYLAREGTTDSALEDVSSVPALLLGVAGPIIAVFVPVLVVNDFLLPVAAAAVAPRAADLMLILFVVVVAAAGHDFALRAFVKVVLLIATVATAALSSRLAAGELPVVDDVSAVGLVALLALLDDDLSGGRLANDDRLRSLR